MKRFLILILTLFCLAASGAGPGYCLCPPQEKDEAQLIVDLEKSIAEQEKLLVSLRAKFNKLLARKKQLLGWIEEEKEKLRQKEARPSQKKASVKPQAAKISPEVKVCPEKPVVSLKSDPLPENGAKERQGLDIKRLDLLIKKQKELSAQIIKLEKKIAEEENKIKNLKETLRTYRRS